MINLRPPLVIVPTNRLRESVIIFTKSHHIQFQKVTRGFVTQERHWYLFLDLVPSLTWCSKLIESIFPLHTLFSASLHMCIIIQYCKRLAAKRLHMTHQILRGIRWLLHSSQTLLYINYIHYNYIKIYGSRVCLRQ